MKRGTAVKSGFIVVLWIHIASQTPPDWIAGDIIGLEVLWPLCFQARYLKA